MSQTLDVHIRQGYQGEITEAWKVKKGLVTLQHGNKNLKCAFEVQQNMRNILSVVNMIEGQKVADVL